MGVDLIFYAFYEFQLSNYIMFKIYQSNQTKILIDKICKLLKKKKNILEEEIFLVENNHFKKWIQIEIAKKIDIHCNIKYINYKKYIHTLIHKSIKKKKFHFLNKKYLTWKFMLSIDKIKKINNIQKMKNIWKKFQFSKYMSSIFIKYIFLRLDWLYEWENNTQNPLISEEDIWQKKIWIHFMNQQKKKKNIILVVFLQRV